MESEWGEKRESKTPISICAQAGLGEPCKNEPVEPTKGTAARGSKSVPWEPVSTFQPDPTEYIPTNSIEFTALVPCLLFYHCAQHYSVTTAPHYHSGPILPSVALSVVSDIVLAATKHVTKGSTRFGMSSSMVWHVGSLWPLCWDWRSDKEFIFLGRTCHGTPTTNFIGLSQWESSHTISIGISRRTME